MIHQTATIEDTVYFWFAANDTSGSGADGATPLFDVREAGAAAGAIPLLSGTPTLLSHANYPAGCHEIAVAATVANGFAENDTFAVFCTLLVDSQNPSGFVGSCTLTPLAKQSQLDNLANVGSATNTSATTYNLTTGTQSAGTFASTVALDGTNHEHTDDTGAMDLYYEFNIGGGTPSSVKVTGYLNGNNDNLEVYGYDWVATAWVQIGTLGGKAASTNEVDEYDLFTAMVGTGANRGLVRVRFTDGAFTLTTATLAVDQIFVSYSAASAGYDGFIWFDSNASNTNTVSNVDGTSGNPVSSEAAVVTLSANLNINRVRVLPGSTYTLASTYSNYFFDGDGLWTLDLAGQNVDGTSFQGATVSGTFSGLPYFIACFIGSITGPSANIHDTLLTGTILADAAGDWFFHHCASGIAGSSTPIFDFGTDVGVSTNVTFGDYANGIEIRNFNNSGTDLFSISGQGQIVYAASSSGTVNQRGDWRVTNTGGVTITSDDNTANLDTITGATGALLDSTATSAQLVDDVLDEVNTGAAHNVTNSLGKQLRAVANRVAYEGTVNDASASTTVFIIDSGASSVDDFYKEQPLIFTDGALTGQARVILGYAGASRTVTLDEALTSAPANGVGILIGADHIHAVTEITADMDANSTQLAAIVLDTGTSIPALLPAALVGGRIDADMGAISTSATSADNLEASTTGIVSTTVNDAAASTTAFIITSSEATDDHFNGRIITFIDGILVGQATDITDYTGATKTVTVTALTEAPGNGDAFVIT